MYRRAVEQILVDGEYGLLNRSRLQLTLHNPGREVSSSSSSYTKSTFLRSLNITVQVRSFLSVVVRSCATNYCIVSLLYKLVRQYYYGSKKVKVIRHFIPDNQEMNKYKINKLYKS